MKKEIKKLKIKTIKAKDLVKRETPEITEKVENKIEEKEKVEVKQPVKFKIVTKIPIPENHIRVVAVKDFDGMQDRIFEGDIFDIPERRFKSLSFRGLVKKYEGDSSPNKRR